MLYRNIFILTILFFYSSAYCAENNLKNLYVKGSYFGVFGNVMGKVSGKEDAGDVTEGIISFSPDEKIVEGYKPQYTPGLNYGSAIGYSLEALELSSQFPSRVEFEVLHSQINLGNEGYTNHKLIKDMAKRFALFRNNAASIVDANAPPLPFGLFNPFDPLDFRNYDNPFLYVINVEPVNENRAIFTIENSGFNNVAALVNAYYDLNLSPHIVPYIGGGLGLTRVKFLERSSFTPAFQLKVGAHYALNDKMQMFAGLRYFGIFSDQFKNILPAAKIVAGSAGINPNAFMQNYDDTARIASTTATITHRFGVYGLEIGMVYNF